MNARPPDRAAAWLAVGFLLSLLASEAALTLPDERAATGTHVADTPAGVRETTSKGRRARP